MVYVRDEARSPRLPDFAPRDTPRADRSAARNLRPLVRRPRLAAAPAPGRHARGGARGSRRAPDRTHGRRQDAGRVPAEPGRADRAGLLGPAAYALHLPPE